MSTRDDESLIAIERMCIPSGRRSVVARLALAAALASLSAGCTPAGLPDLSSTPDAKQASNAKQGPGPKQATIALSINFGDGRRREIGGTPWGDGLTVIDVMTSAQKRGLKFEQRGSGETAFVEAIDGVRNAGDAAGARNWLFFVNGRKGQEGAGATKLQPGDHVLWKYTDEQ